jgi:DNA end-binding protein Ku
MAPIPLWSGNLRLSLVLVPVKLYPAESSEGSVSFRMIHRESGEPIKYQKGIETDRGFKEVPDVEIVKGYEYEKGRHVLIEPKELDELKLEAKHTIDLARFVDEADISSQYWEKPYYLLPDGDEADEGYVVLRDALAKTGKVAIGQLIMHGREHLVGIRALGKGLMLEILRYANEVRPAESYFEKITTKPKADAVQLASDLIERESGPFEPQMMPNEYAQAVHELVAAKVEQRAPEVEIEPREERVSNVVNIMDALKQSIQAKGRVKVREAVRRRMGDKAPKERAARPKKRPERRPTRTAH